MLFILFCERHNARIARKTSPFLCIVINNVVMTNCTARKILDIVSLPGSLPGQGLWHRSYTHRCVAASYFNVTRLPGAAPSGCCVPVTCNIMHLKTYLCAAVYNVVVSAYILSYIPIYAFMSMSVCVCVYIFIYPICNILNLISFVYVMCHKISKVLNLTFCL